MSALRDSHRNLVARMEDGSPKFSDRLRRFGRGNIATGRNRHLDSIVVWSVVEALGEINLNRWRTYDPEVAAALVEARDAARRLSAAIFEAYRRGGWGKR